MAAEFTVIPIPPVCPDEAYAETSPDATGTDQILDDDSQPIAGFNQFSTLPDGTVVDYKITADSIDIEWGLGTYNAGTDKIDRAAQYSLVGAGFPDPLSGTVPQEVVSQGMTADGARAILREVGWSPADIDALTPAQWIRTARAIEIARRPGPAVIPVSELAMINPTADITMAIETNPGMRLGRALALQYNANPPSAWGAGSRPGLSAQAELEFFFTLPGGAPGMAGASGPWYPPIETVNDLLWYNTVTKDYFHMPASASTAAQRVAEASRVANTPNVVIANNAILQNIINAQKKPGVVVPIGFQFPPQPVTRLSTPGVSQLIQARKALGAAGQAVAIIGMGIQVKNFLDGVSDFLSVSLVQGRLQLNTVVAGSDAERWDFGNIVYFTPCLQREPREARVTLNCPLPLPGVGWTFAKFHWAITTTGGDSPSVDVSKASTAPFRAQAGRMRSMGAAEEGIPADIFMWYPLRYSLDEQAFILGVSNGLQPPLGGPPEFNLPRMFHLNWDSATSRNNGSGRGYSLVNTQNLGLCLNALSVGDGGFIVGTAYPLNGPLADGPGVPIGQNIAPIHPSFFLYLGTVVRSRPFLGGSLRVMCYPGKRTIWNRYNRISYNDYLPMIPRVIPFNRMAQPGYRTAMSALNNACSHVYVDPSDGSDLLPALNPVGAMTTVIVGPISVLIKQGNDLLSQDNGTAAQITGNADCTPLTVSWFNVRLFESARVPGLHTIILYQGMDGSFDCRQKKYAYVNLFVTANPTIYYSPNVGYTGLATDTPFSNLFGAPDRGFGFQGDC